MDDSNFRVSRSTSRVVGVGGGDRGPSALLSDLECSCSLEVEKSQNASTSLAAKRK